MNIETSYSTVKLMEEMWYDTKEKMKQDNYIYEDMEEARDRYPFFDRLCQVYGQDIELKEEKLNGSIQFTRVIGEDNCNIDRMIPKEKYKRLNRMNPKDKCYGYFNIGYGGRNINQRILTGIKETRSESREFVSSCEFTYNTNGKKLIKFIPDSILKSNFDERYINEDILNIMQRFCISKGRKGREKAVKIYAWNIMMSVMLKTDIFKPIDTDDENVKYYEYAPFHLISNYFEKLGYAGIIFPSSVDKGGYCVAIFEPKEIVPIKETLRNYLRVNDYM